MNEEPAVGQRRACSRRTRSLRDRTVEISDLNAFMQSILGSLEAAVVVVDPDLVVQVWTRQAHDLWGLRDDETVGQHLLNLDSGMPSAQPAPVAALGHHRAAAGGGRRGAAGGQPARAHRAAAGHGDGAADRLRAGGRRAAAHGGRLGRRPRRAGRPARRGGGGLARPVVLAGRRGAGPRHRLLAHRAGPSRDLARRCREVLDVGGFGAGHEVVREGGLLLERSHRRPEPSPPTSRPARRRRSSGRTGGRRDSAGR
nr:hypothetical protein [Angustibacter aerolatus]